MTNYIFSRLHSKTNTQRVILGCLFLLFLTAPSNAKDWWPFGKDKTNSEKPATAEIKINEAPLSRETRLTTSFSSIVAEASPAVVSIKSAAYQRQQKVHPLLREFFNIPEDADTGKGRLRPLGIGSGVIVSKDGYILTNNHVISDADEIFISLAEDADKEFPAKVVGTDPRSDLAVLKMDIGRDLPTATFGNSDLIEVGDIVLAIGTPFGLGQTVTMGIISATGRQTVIPPQSGVLYQDFIQTDASINQGNSGGALIDAEGRLIGINTAIFSRTGENLGIGFAVPVNMARNVMEQLIKEGKVRRGYLGVNIEPVTEEMAEFSGLDSKSGALITNVEKDSPSDKAGMRPGDIITTVAGRPIKSVSDLLLTVSQQTPGQSVDIEVLRNGKKMKLSVVPTERPDESDRPMGAKPEKADPDEEEVGGNLFAGISIQDITAPVRTQLRLPDGVGGTLVTRVAPGTPAAEAGLSRGMVILEIANASKVYKIQSSRDALAAAKEIRGKIARLYVWANGGYRYLVIKEN